MSFKLECQMLAASKAASRKRQSPRNQHSETLLVLHRRNGARYIKYINDDCLFSTERQYEKGFPDMMRILWRKECKIIETYKYKKGILYEGTPWSKSDFDLVKRIYKKKS